MRTAGPMTAPAGIYHCTNSGQTTRLGFARAVRAEFSGGLGGEPLGHRRQHGPEPGAALGEALHGHHQPVRHPDNDITHGVTRGEVVLDVWR